MKSILMIAYFFPPEGNAGSYRPLRFVRALASVGWDVRVISVNPLSYERYDPELLSAIPREIEVIRVRGEDWWQAIQAWRRKRLNAELAVASFERNEKIHSTHKTSFRSKVRKAVRKIEYAYYIPDRAKPWIRPAFLATYQACLSQKPDVIWATVGPLSSGLVAFRVSQQTGIPYVLDFRDPWGLKFFQIDLMRPKFAAHRVQRIMREIFNRAQSVVFLFDSVAESYLRDYAGVLDEKKIHIIPNGFEGSLEEFSLSPAEMCTIVYAGTLSTYRYDTLLLGLQILKQQHSMLAKRLRVLFVGDGNESLRRAVIKLGLTDIIETKGTVPYLEILKIQRNSHALLILGRSSEVEGHELVAGAKLFGYLKARRPIIGVLPHDATRKVLVNVGVSTIADVDSPAEIAVVFQRVVEAWSDGRLREILPDPEVCKSYSSQRQRDALIDALEGKIFSKGIY